MEDNVEVTEQQVSTELPQEVKDMMAISLNNGVMPEVKESVGAAPESATTVVVEEPAFSFDILKEKYAYEKPEDVFKEIDELRNYRANPTPAEIKYENEQSKNIALALQKGDFAPVYAYLDEQMKLDQYTTAEVTDQTADDIIKLGMQVEYKDLKLTKAEIDYKFKKDFGFPKEPVMLDTEDEAEFAERKALWQEQVDDIKMNKIIAAKLMKPKLELSKSKLTLPTIVEQVDEDYIQYKNQLEENQKSSNEATAEYQKLTPEAISTKINFNDEANKIKLDFDFKPDSESFSKAIDMVSNTEKFQAAFANQDGTPNRQKFLETIYFGLNKDKILLAAMNEVKNATIKASLPDNSQGGMVRQLPQSQELSELDKQMQMSLNGYGRTWVR